MQAAADSDSDSDSDDELPVSQPVSQDATYREGQVVWLKIPNYASWPSRVRSEDRPTRTPLPPSTHTHKQYNTIHTTILPACPPPQPSKQIAAATLKHMGSMCTSR